MVFQKRIWLLVLLLLALAGAVSFQIFQISQTEKIYPISILQKQYEVKTENLYPTLFTTDVGKSGYAYGYVNQDAQLFVQPQFERGGKFSEGFAPVRINKKWGFINLKGLLSIPPKYDNIGYLKDYHHNLLSDTSDDYLFPRISFSEGLVGVKLKDKWGFINQSGELVIPYQFDQVQRFSGGVATVRVGKLWGVISPKGKWIIPPVHELPITFFQGIAFVVNSPGNINFYDKSGRLNKRPKLAKEFQEGLAIIETSVFFKKPGFDIPPTVASFEYRPILSSFFKCGFQDKQGKIIIEPYFHACQHFSSGLAPVQVGEKWGYIDKTGQFIVKPQFDYADRLFEERGLVVSNGKIGFIDPNGLLVIKPEFEIIIDFPDDNNNLVKKKNTKFFQRLDPSSSDVIPHRFSHGLAAVALKDKCGYIDKIGRFVIPPEFTRCKQFDSYGVAEVNQRSVGGKWDEYLYINSEGKIFPQEINSLSLSNFYPTKIKLLASVILCLFWISAISFHEFGHAIVAYWGGDYSVKDKGYLSFNPVRYVHPLHSIIIPAIFLVIGVIPLPGAAVYIEFDEIRNRLWLSATAAAWSLASILFGLVLVPIFHVSLASNFPYWLSALIAIFINFQFITGLFNLLPIPPLDGYRIISVWLPRQLQDRTGIASIIGLFFIYFILPLILILILPLISISLNLMLSLGISKEFSLNGWYLLNPLYVTLPLIVGGIVYLVLLKKP